MTVEEALEFFQHHPKLRNKLQTLYAVGLGYVKLGQPATTLSGGEAQRIKLSKDCLLYTSPSPRDRTRSRMPSSA